MIDRGKPGRGDGRIAARQTAGLPQNLFHLLPHGAGEQKSGVTLTAGSDFHERREIIGRVAQVYLVIEGGPGTQHEAAVAAAQGAALIPLGRTGGWAGTLHARMSCPEVLAKDDWELLAEVDAPHEQVVGAVGRLVRAALIAA